MESQIHNYNRDEKREKKAVLSSFPATHISYMSC